jgi:putative tryptophan/tyrosine transport system substrate-binding protein
VAYGHSQVLMAWLPQIPAMVTDRLVRKRVVLCLLAAVAGFGMMAPRAGADTLVVLSDQTASYQQVVDELRAGLKSARDGGARIEVLAMDRLAVADDAFLKNYELVITVGLAAARSVLARAAALPASPPTVCLLIPRQAFEALVPAHADARPRRVSAVYLDQPLARQLDLLRIALPNRSRVGVVLGPTSAGLANELREGARQRDLVLNTADVAEPSGVYNALLRVLPASDVLLALPDPVAFNASTVYGLMLTSYRAQVPVIGFSEGLVKAGALLGLYSTASQVGRQGTEIANRILAGDAVLPPPQYPRYFTVRANQTVARSLSISLQDETALTTALTARSESRRESPRPAAANDASTPGRTP